MRRRVRTSYSPLLIALKWAVYLFFCLFFIFWRGGEATGECNDCSCYGLQRGWRGRQGLGGERVRGRGWGRLLGQIAAAIHSGRAAGCRHIIRHAKYLEVTHLMSNVCTSKKSKEQLCIPQPITSLTASLVR